MGSPGSTEPTQRTGEVCNASRADSQHGCPTREVLSHGGGLGSASPRQEMLPSTYSKSTTSAEACSRRLKQIKADQGEGHICTAADSRLSVCSLSPPPLSLASEKTHSDECRGGE